MCLIINILHQVLVLYSNSLDVLSAHRNVISRKKKHINLPKAIIHGLHFSDGFTKYPSLTSFLKISILSSRLSAQKSTRSYLQLQNQKSNVEYWWAESSATEHQRWHCANSMEGLRLVDHLNYLSNLIKLTVNCVGQQSYKPGMKEDISTRTWLKK